MNFRNKMSTCLVFRHLNIYWKFGSAASNMSETLKEIDLSRYNPHRRKFTLTYIISSVVQAEPQQSWERSSPLHRTQYALAVPTLPLNPGNMKLLPLFFGFAYAGHLCHSNIKVCQSLWCDSSFISHNVSMSHFSCVYPCIGIFLYGYGYMSSIPSRNQHMSSYLSVMDILVSSTFWLSPILLV